MPTSSDLQPIAVDHALEGESVRAGRDEAIEMRKFRRLAFAHIGKQNAVALDDRIGLLPDLLHSLLPSGSAGVSRHWPLTSNSQP